eukprot:13044623-Heterocapsa_arctica.AAC.1
MGGPLGVAARVLANVPGFAINGLAFWASGATRALEAFALVGVAERALATASGGRIGGGAE